MNFSRALRRYANRRKADMDDIIVEALVSITSSVVIRTPVDTGLARSNWQPTVDRRSTQTVRTIRTGGVVIDTAEGVIRDSIGSVYYLVNNLPYIRRLEYDGWSAQAPRGMVRVSIENFEKFLDDSIAKYS